MPSTTLTLSARTLLSFLLVLAPVGGSLVLLPLQGIPSAREPARAALGLGFTMALMGRWPSIDASGMTAARLAGWAASEAALGIAIGISVAIELEAFGLAAQVLGLQAGY